MAKATADRQQEQTKDQFLLALYKSEWWERKHVTFHPADDLCDRPPVLTPSVVGNQGEVDIVKVSSDMKERGIYSCLARMAFAYRASLIDRTSAEARPVALDLESAS